MSEMTRVARQVWRGVPYLKKEVGRKVSMAVGKAVTTPQTYYVIFSGRCNVACTFCTIYKEVEPMIPEEAMLRIIREAKELSGSGFNMSLSGGEPLIYKPLYKALELADQLGVDFGFTTNGYLLTKTNVAKALEFDPFNINVSLEAVDPVMNESVRPRRDGTRQTLDGINNLVMEKRRTGSRVSILVKSTIMNQTYKGLPELVRHFKKYPEVQVHLQTYVGPADTDFWINDTGDLRRVLNEVLELRESGHNVVLDAHTVEGFVGYFAAPPKNHNDFPRLDLHGAKRNCDIAYRVMGIYPNGDVQFCDYLNKAVGNIHKQSLSEIYFGEVANKLRRGITGCNIDCQRTCQRPIPIMTKVRTFLKMG
jgi:MoaA/NifB/PqqE/SkfB family radical SAM enzyme